MLVFGSQLSLECSHTHSFLYHPRQLQSHNGKSMTARSYGLQMIPDPLRKCQLTSELQDIFRMPFIQLIPKISWLSFQSEEKESYLGEIITIQNDTYLQPVSALIKTGQSLGLAFYWLLSCSVATSLSWLSVSYSLGPWASEFLLLLNFPACFSRLLFDLFHLSAFPLSLTRFTNVFHILWIW